MIYRFLLWSHKLKQVHNFKSQSVSLRQKKIPTEKFLKNEQFRNDFKCSNAKNMFYIDMSKQYFYLVCSSSLVCRINNINDLCMMAYHVDFYIQKLLLI